MYMYSLLIWRHCPINIVVVTNLVLVCCMVLMFVVRPLPVQQRILLNTV